MQDIPLTRIKDNPFQTRLEYDQAEVEQLGRSIQAQGLLQAPVGRPMADGTVELAFGHRRLRAFRWLAEDDPAWRTMPVILKGMSDEAMALAVWSENRDRQDITAIEEARALQRYLQTFGWTQRQLADRLKLDPSTISNRLRLLRLPEPIQSQIAQRQLSERQAVALLPLLEVPNLAEWDQGQWEPVVGSREPRKITPATFPAEAHLFDSGRIRAIVTNLIEKNTMAIGLWGETPIVSPEVVQPLCAGCPFNLKDRCAKPACAGRKRADEGIQQAQIVAAAHGLRVETADLEYDRVDRLTYSTTLPAIVEEAQRRKCGQLVVVPNAGRYITGLVDKSYPACSVVCHHKETRFCACLSAITKSNDPNRSIRAKEQAEQDRIAQEIVPAAVPTLARALATRDVATWRTIGNLLTNNRISRVLANASTIDQVCEAIAHELLRHETRYSSTVDGANKAIALLLGRFPSAALAAPEPAPPPEPNPYDHAFIDFALSIYESFSGMQWATNNGSFDLVLLYGPTERREDLLLLEPSDVYHWTLGYLPASLVGWIEQGLVELPEHLVDSPLPLARRVELELAVLAATAGFEDWLMRAQMRGDPSKRDASLEAAIAQAATIDPSLARQWSQRLERRP